MLPYFNLSHASTVQYMAERDGDQSHAPPPFTLASDASRPYPILFNNLQDQSDTDHCHIQQYPLKHQTTLQFLISGTSSRLVSKVSMDDEEDNIGVDNLKLSLCDHYDKEDGAHVSSSSKRMPSKMSIMRKTMNNVSDRGNVADGARPIAMYLPLDRSGWHQGLRVSGQSNDNNSPFNTIRVCSDCGTTKTPLWRSGPCGPKSLCNACGIRQRKARRAIAAAAANGGLLPPRHASMSAKVRKLDQKKLDVAADRTVPFKKRCKLLGAAAGTTAQAKLCLEDVTLSLGTSSTFERVFPQDERDAAVLLMAMSCGII